MEDDNNKILLWSALVSGILICAGTLTFLICSENAHNIKTGGEYIWFAFFLAFSGACLLSGLILLAWTMTDAIGLFFLPATQEKTDYSTDENRLSKETDTNGSEGEKTNEEHRHETE